MFFLQKYACKKRVLTLFPMFLLPLSSLNAKTLPQLTKNCFTYTVEQENKGAHSLKESKFKAELVNTGLSLEITHISFSDDNNHLNGDALDRINAAAAYGVLSAAFHGISPNCTGQPLPEIDEIKNTRPNAQWNSVTFIHKNFSPFLIQNIHLSVPSTSPSIHVLVTATGLHKTGQALIPKNLNADLTFEPASAPPYTITLKDVQAEFDNSSVKATGKVLAAGNVKESHANIHLAISHIGAFMNEAEKIAPASIYSALTIARFISHKDAPHVTGWDIELQNAKITVNGIHIPYGL